MRHSLFQNLMGKGLQNFNISIGITNTFMDAVEKNKDWQLVNPRTKKITKTIKAKILWDLIVEQAQKTGEPGLIFLDTINQENPLPKQGENSLYQSLWRSTLVRL